MKRFLVNLSLAVASILVVLLVAEIVLHIYRSLFAPSTKACYVSSPTPELPFVAKANFQRRGYATNSQHLRSPEIPLEKPPATFRVAVVGNSVTIGHAVKQEELFTAVMERDFQAAFNDQPPVDIINAGQEGYGMAYFLPFSRLFVYPYQPDVMIYQFCWNDIEVSSAYRVSRPPDQLPTNPVLRFLLKNSVIYGYIHKLSGVTKLANRLVDYYDDSTAVEGFFNDLATWEQDAENRQVHFLVVIFPMAMEVQAPEQYPDIVAKIHRHKEAIMAECRRRNIEVYDVTEVIRQDYEEHHQRLFVDLGHFNARGHAVAGHWLENLVQSTAGPAISLAQENK